MPTVKVYRRGGGWYRIVTDYLLGGEIFMVRGRKNALKIRNQIRIQIQKEAQLTMRLG